MKKNILLVAGLYVGFLLSGCNNNSAKTVGNPGVQDEPGKSATAAQSTVCYILENGKDTVSLKMHINNNQVSGDLLYHYFEKDRNTGTIKGEMKGDTLFAKYTFMSEGKESRRDIVFLKNGDELTEGYANLNPTTGEPDFTDHSAIKFDNKFVLKKSGCQ